MSTRRKLQRHHKLFNQPQPLAELRPASAVEVRLDHDCPFCSAEVLETGDLGCCGAETADCVGFVDGVSANELEDDDERWDRLVRHSWYVDSSEPAPLDGGPPLPCRCQAR